MRVLVVFGSKRGGTAEIAAMVAQVLEERGLQTDVVDARAADPAGFDAVVAGSSVYNGRWHRDTRRFLKRHAASLGQVPMWCFSSGPLDDSAATHEIPPPKHVASLIDEVAPGRHITFGGRLAPDARGFPASAMARNGRAGDWRDETMICEWAAQIAGALIGTTVDP